MTATGPGGVGKTRLALAVADILANEFADGVAFVSLAGINDPSLLVATIVQTLGVREAPTQSAIDTLVSALCDRHVLLILDNCEHLVGPDAFAAIAVLCQACPELKVLSTSRTPLHLRGEHLFVTPPLTLPPPHVFDPDVLAKFGAVSLFEVRARQTGPEFALTVDNAASVAEICYRLDGLPLAIELAAAWTRILCPKELLARLDPRLALLHGRNFAHPPRLRTMRNAIAWSYELLSEEEQQMFRRLAIFVGGFTLEGAEWLARGECEGTTGRSTTMLRDPLDLIANLVDKSLVQRDPTSPTASLGAAPRFTMLETVREFGLEQLAAHEETDMMEASRAQYVLSLAERADPELSGAQQNHWFERLEAEHPDLRAALSWYRRQEDLARGLLLANALSWFWSSRGHFGEARRWFEILLAGPEITPTRARGLAELANILHWQGDFIRAAASAGESLALSQELGDQFSAAVAIRRLASIAIDQKDFERAALLLAESSEVMRVVGTAWDAAFAKYLSGRLALAMNRNTEAASAFSEASAAFTMLGDRAYVAAALCQHGLALIGTGSIASAAASLVRSLELACELKDQAWIARALAGAGHVATVKNKPAIGARLFGAASAIREAIGERPLPTSPYMNEARSALGAGRFVTEWSRGGQISLMDAVDEARHILSGSPIRAIGPESSGERQAALSRRETQVLALLAIGCTDRDIANTLDISRRTASNHVGALLRKFQVTSRTEAVARAIGDGLFQELGAKPMA